MTTRDTIQKAKKAFGRKKFSSVISLLLPLIYEFESSYQFFYMLGVSCLYTDDLEGAEVYLEKASKLREDTAETIMALAALSLRKCDVKTAVLYYLKVLELNPLEKIANEALEFIRISDSDTVNLWISDKRIQKYYPVVVSKASSSFDFDLLKKIVLWTFVSVFAVFLGYFGVRLFYSYNSKNRKDISDISLSLSEKMNSVYHGDTGVAGQAFKYEFSSLEIASIFDKAKENFQNYRDNAALVEINKILCSNAVTQVQQKALVLKSYLNVPKDFNDVKDNYSYEEVVKEPYKYLDCWVVWEGNITNVIELPNQFQCDLLIGSEDLSKIDGIVPFYMREFIRIDEDRPIKVLAQIALKDGKIFLKGKSVYQSLVSN